MTEDLREPWRLGRNSAERPLLGLTILLVEDSRFTCEAVRMMCQRSGARLRRADCLASARRHLQSYRPTVIIVDLGLPDGSGEELIAELSQSTPRLPVIIGTSGSADGAELAMAAGADGFMPKPFGSLTQFQQSILTRLDGPAPRLAAVSPDDRVVPDPLALRDDLSRAAEVLQDAAEANLPAGIIYVSKFLEGVARSAGDRPLEEAAKHLIAGGDPLALAGLINNRLTAQTTGMLR